MIWCPSHISHGSDSVYWLQVKFLRCTCRIGTKNVDRPDRFANSSLPATLSVVIGPTVEPLTSRVTMTKRINTWKCTKGHDCLRITSDVLVQVRGAAAIEWIGINSSCTNHKANWTPNSKYLIFQFKVKKNARSQHLGPIITHTHTHYSSDEFARICNPRLLACLKHWREDVLFGLASFTKILDKSIEFKSNYIPCSVLLFVIRLSTVMRSPNPAKLRNCCRHSNCIKALVIGYSIWEFSRDSRSDSSPRKGWVSGKGYNL